MKPRHFHLLTKEITKTMASERTNDLKKLIQTKLKTKYDNVFFEQGQQSKMFPSVVYNLRSVDLGDLSRKDYILEIDVWTKGESTYAIDNMTDIICDLLQAENLPQTTILPVFYLIDSRAIIDEDKEINHRLIRFQVQLYDV